MAQSEDLASPSREYAHHSVESEPPSQFLLHAPPGWQKKITSTKKGGKKDVSFVAPDGEEFKSKRTLDRYLKNHAGGPTASEFDWSNGETATRRSSRISSRTPPSIKSSEEGSAKKRHRKSEKDETKLEPITKDEADIPVSITKEEEEIEGNEHVRDEKMEDVLEVKGEEETTDVEANDIKKDEIVDTNACVEEEVKAAEAIETNGMKNDEIVETNADVEKEVKAAEAVETNDMKNDEIVKTNTGVEEEVKTAEAIETKDMKNDEIVEDTNMKDKEEEETVKTKEYSNVEDIAPVSAASDAPIEEEGATTIANDDEKKTEEVQIIQCAEKKSTEVVITKADIDEANTGSNNENKFEKTSDDELNQKCPDQSQKISMPVHVST